MERERAIILPVQEAIRHLEGEDPEQQLFAGAVQVAAFLFHTIENSASLDSLSSIFYKVIPGIVMIGTAPISHKVHCCSLRPLSVQHKLPMNTTLYLLSNDLSDCRRKA